MNQCEAVHKPCPPIWIANNPHIFGARPDIVRRTVERVGRLADGWMTMQASPEQFSRSWAEIRESAARNDAFAPGHYAPSVVGSEYLLKAE